MRGLEAIGLIRAFEREHPALRPAVLIMCSGAALDAEAGWEENGEHTDRFPGRVLRRGREPAVVN